MSKLKKPPKVYQISHGQRLNEAIVSKFYYFRIQHDKKRKIVNTGLKNKRKAQEYVDALYSSEVKFSAFVKEHFEGKAEEAIAKEAVAIPDEELTVLETLEKQGWLNWETNPKMISSQRDGKNYGSRHAKNLALALNHMFMETDKYNWFSDKKLSSIKREDAQGLSSQLWQDRTCRGKICEEDIVLKDTIGDYKINLISLKTFFTYCFSDLGITDINPFQSIKIPQSKIVQLKAFFTAQQLRTMFNRQYLESLEFDTLQEKQEWMIFIDSQYFKSFFFTALTGLRSAEVRALKWKQLSDDVQLKINRAFKENTNNENDVDTPKWDKVRTIILCDSAYRIIRETEVKDNEAYVFFNSIGNAIDASTWGKKFTYFISALKGKLLFSDDPYTPHSFRGTLNSLLVKEGNVSDALIRKYLGWTEVNTLSAVQEKHYTRFFEEDMLKVAEAIEVLFSDKTLQHEYISEEEKHELASLYVNNSYYNSNRLAQKQLDDKTRLEILKSHKNKIFKTFNNYILYDENLDESKRNELLSHCKKIIKTNLTTLSDMDIAFPQNFKKYASRNWDAMPPAVQLSLSLLLDIFAADLDKEKEILQT